MKSNLLKKLNANLPGPVKKLLGPYIRKQLFNNKIFKQQLNNLRQADNTYINEVKKRQFNKLKEALIHAYEHTVYYKHKFDVCGFDVYNFSKISEMAKIPLLTRADIIENFESLQADNITDFYKSTTGGSSGASLNILLDKDSIYRERAFIYHFWSKCGYDYKTSRIASFRGGVEYKGKIHRYNPLYNEIQLNPCLINGDTINKYYSLINKFKADFIHGLPSAVYSFCKYANQLNQSLKGKYKAVLFISENVYQYQREYIEKTLACKSYAYYGHTERAVFAEQSGDGYNFNNDYCYVEFDDGVSGNIITTGFINRKMPLIRYELDDSATKIPDTDSYEITGHRDGILYGKNGEIISAASLYVHDDVMDKVANLQFIQKQAGKVILLINPLIDIIENERKTIEVYYQKKLGSTIDIKVEISNDMIYTSRGKMPLIVHIDFNQ